MNALVGLVAGLAAGTLSVGSLWLITGIAAQAARGLRPPHAKVDRPTAWDIEAQDPDVLTAGQWWRREAIPTAPPTVERQEDVRGATLRVLFAFLLKVPVLFLIARGAQSLGSVGLHWCVGGVVLVYFLAVLWAAARTHQG